MADVSFTVDGKKLTAPAGTLLIDACKSAGIEIPAFCYYPGLSLQAACRMCVVRIEKQPKLATACTTTVAEGMNVTTESPEIAQARKATLQLLLGNHPLDCPVCDAGGECELQDMTFKYGAADSFYTEPKNHREEQQWSPVVYFDRPRCILCYRCVRMCGEGMDIFALGVQNRGSSSVIAPNIPVSESPNGMAALDCEQCGMCIDACPVGALTSGTYRYKTRPWEMNHVATVCTHCGDGCKTTLGVRSVSDGSEIVRGDNRDKSGMNGDFLCNKGRYAFDFANNIERLTSPLVRKDGKLVPVSWEEALGFAGKRLREIRDEKGANAVGVIGSNRTTNEESYLLQKFARTVIGTNNIDHHRTADYVTLATALQGTTTVAGKPRFASQRCVEKSPAILLVGGDPTNEAPLTAWNIRTNVRLNKARVYVANHRDIKLKRQAKAFTPVAEFGYAAFIDSLGEENEFTKAVKSEEKLLVVVGNELRGGELAKLIAALPHAKFALLADYANSRGAADMGVLPDALPGYQPLTGSAIASEYTSPSEPGLDLLGMFDAAANGKLAALYVVGSNPVKRYGIDATALKDTFVIVQDMFLTETAMLADVVLPAANLYEKSGSVTNSYGDVQLVSKAADKAGVRSDFEMIVRLADKFGHEIKTLVPFGKGLRADMGQTRGAQSGEADRHSVWLTANNMEPKLSPFDPFAILDEIQRLVPGYDKLLRLQLLSGNDQHIAPAGSGLVQISGSRKDLVLPAADSLFTSGSLTRYSPMLQDVQRHQADEAATPLASAD
ncbi:molybdopterin-dependent oxidoreductase [Granulicella sp. 5B5]|uniref:molybdopterin-dependent oxidoreductase n=1 Tax=Granulicella sp. 5B5 TaxID=1617967 RepID=UPI0015F62F29|nr:molybdopterin-dependent oxidoreductase [Granulicella sp. 5B5]QMV17582.1 molybdopterin-dependent oxidoreductase [Granulicella sp. 5B5]